MTVGSDPGSSTEPAEPADPPIRVGARGAEEDPEVRSLLARAGAALEFDAGVARRLALEVVEQHPEAVGSSGAFRILARADSASGDFVAAEGWVERFAALLPAGDHRVVELRILAGDVAAADGRAVDAVGHWLRVPATAEGSLISRAVIRTERLAERLEEGELEQLLARGTPGPAAAPIAAELALERFVAGDREAAATLGRQALDLGAEGRTERIARGAVSGNLREFVVAPRVGLILPTTGSPRLRAVAREIREGIQVAVAEFGQQEGQRLAVELLSRDNRGQPGIGTTLVEELEEAGALAVIGPLQEGLFEEVAATRDGPIVIVSPTSPIVPADYPSVYSIQGPEDGAARALATYASQRGISSAVLLYPDNIDARFEADAFRDHFGELGGVVVGELTYPPGATFFEEQIRAAATFAPEVLVLPIPARDVELLAPQVTFFGLDSLGIEVLGTNGWTDPDVLSRVDPRHTNGVIATSPQPAAGESEGLRRFRESYERMYSNTLRSNVPAYGYDAARMVLEVIRGGATTPEGVAESVTRLEGLPGATGRISVREGRVVREHYLVCLDRQRPRDLAEGERPTYTLFPPLPDPETDSIPEGATPRIMGYRCPGTPRPFGALDETLFHPDSAFLRPDTTAVADTTVVRDTLNFPRR